MEKKKNVPYNATPEERQILLRMRNEMLGKGFLGFLGGFGVSNATLWYLHRKRPDVKIAVLPRVGFTLGLGALCALVLVSSVMTRYLDEIVHLDQNTSPLAKKGKDYMYEQYRWNEENLDEIPADPIIPSNEEVNNLPK